MSSLSSLHLHKKLCGENTVEKNRYLFLDLDKINGSKELFFNIKSFDKSQIQNCTRKFYNLLKKKSPYFGPDPA